MATVAAATPAVRQTAGYPDQRNDFALESGLATAKNPSVELRAEKTPSDPDLERTGPSPDSGLAFPASPAPAIQDRMAAEVTPSSDATGAISDVTNGPRLAKDVSAAA
jgi:hypothetical protein